MFNILKVYGIHLLFKVLFGFIGRFTDIEYYTILPPQNHIHPPQEIISEWSLNSLKHYAWPWQTNPVFVETARLVLNNLQVNLSLQI